MSPQRRGSKRGSGWKPPRDRREIVTAVLASLTVLVVTIALIWFLRPNRDSGSSPSDTVVTTPLDGSTTTPTTPPTTAPRSSADTTAPTETSTP